MCHRHLLDARDRGVKFIVADPRMTPTAGLADIHLQFRPASTAALAAGPDARDLRGRPREQRVL